MNIKEHLSESIAELTAYKSRIEFVMEGLPTGDISMEIKNGCRYYRELKGNRRSLGKADDPEVAGRLKYQVCSILLENVNLLLDLLEGLYKLVPIINLNELEKYIPEKYDEFSREVFGQLELIDERTVIQQHENTYMGYSDGLWRKTKTGIYVRSLAEQTIADRLTDSGIIYEYEPTLPNKSGPELHPDFRIFDPNTNQWIYIEYIGMLSRREYSEQLSKKIVSYMEMGIYPAVNLFLIYANDDGSVNLNQLEVVIRMLKRLAA